MLEFDPITRENIENWLQGSYDTHSKSEIRRMMEESPEQVVDAFYTKLSFGTGGMRGIVGVGTNRLNSYTIMAAAQGVANYLNKQGGSHSVCIGYDSRTHSKAFAETAANVLSGNGIHTYLFKELRPTPLISFCCRFKRCSAAIMVTASHNPPEYNGFKVYYKDGGQVVPPHDKGIVAEVNKITDLSQIESNSSLVELIGSELDEEYTKAIHSYQCYANANKKYGKELKVVYTSLHGTGITLIPKVLQSWGFCCHLVAEQCLVDGSFPTVKIPNPEERSALKMGIETLTDVQGDILIATDPDADRLAVAVNHRGEIELLTGNQTASICLEHLLKSRHKSLPQRSAAIKTIVTTELFRKVAEAYGVRCFDVLTGFKYIAELIHEWEQSDDGFHFLYGAEESYGYLLGDKVRDKDAVISAALICEVALQAKKEGITLIDLLHRLYQKYGVYREMLTSLYFGEGKSNRERMDRAMEELRKNPPKAIYGIPVIATEDYQNSLRTDSFGKKTISLPTSDVYAFYLQDESKLVVRPSGTEPKIKLYSSVCKPSLSSCHNSVIAECDHLADQLLKELAKGLSGRA